MVKEKVIDLCDRISGTKRGAKNETKPEFPEYRIVEPIVTDEMAEIALWLEHGKLQSAEEVAALCGKPVEEVDKVLYQLALYGVIALVPKNGVDKYKLEIWVPGIMEFMVANKELIKKYPQIPQCFEEYTRRVGFISAGNIPIGMGFLRVIPVASAIEGETHSASYEEILHYLDYYNSFSCCDCVCRVTRRENGEGCGHTAEDMCIQLGEYAEYYIHTGRGRRITREEALAIIDKAEKEGLIHEVTNTTGPGKSHAICNCCGCSCLSLRSANLYRNPDSIRSNYVAQVDRDKCVACGECVEHCQVNALTLGQNLCTKQPIAEPEKETPYDTAWGPDKWNTDYRHRKVVAESGTSPCKTECPAHIAIQGYINMAAHGKYREALELIKKENPFPAICGRVCPRNCESACTRGSLDAPLAIDDIKKFIADQDLKSAHRFVPEKNTQHSEKIAIIGAGPAGLSCAYFLAVNGYQVTVFEKQQTLGGMLTLGIPPFRLGREVVSAEIEILRELGIEFKTGVEIGKDVSLRELRRLDYKAFYLAIGAQTGKTLGIEGEDAEGVITGVEFLRRVNLNGDVKLRGSVIVIGGGMVAIDVARTAVRVGASQVGMYCLETRKEMPAIGEEIEETLEENVAINNSWGPKRIITENGHSVGVEFKKCISLFDENKKFNPVYDENDTILVTADYVLVSIGQSMEWGGIIKGSKIELKPNKTVIVDEISFQTGEADVFAGGDVVTGPKFTIDAIAAGKQGATSIHRYVHGDNLTLGREREYRPLDKENINLDGYDRLPRQRALDSDNNTIEDSFKDLRNTFTEEQLKKETERCLGCGAVVLDQIQCVGCGICTTKCKFDAISLTRKFDNAVMPTLPEQIVAIVKNAKERFKRIAAKQAAEQAQKETATTANKDR